MNLKESFRYQNFLDEIFNKAMMYLNNNMNLFSVKMEHMRKKANPEAEDETEIVCNRTLEVDNNLVVLFVLDIMEERDALTRAISKTKAASATNMDSEIFVNKLRRHAASVFSRMAELKTTEGISRGTGYKFNAEGNQVPYSYEIKEVRTIDFDRNRVKNLSRKLLAESDEASAKIDLMMVESQVAFTPKYFVSGTFEDALEAFAAQHELNKKAV